MARSSDNESSDLFMSVSICVVSLLSIINAVSAICVVGAVAVCVWMYVSACARVHGALCSRCQMYYVHHAGV